MSILIDKDTPVVVQGITGNHGKFHTKHMLKAGTNIVAGVTPGKGGETIEGIPVYNSIQEAKSKHSIEWSVLFVPAEHAKKACLEALEEDLHCVIISEHVPVHDTIFLIHKAKEKKKHIVGPNCPGIIVPEETKLGIMPNHVFKKGSIGIVSRSGTLTYEVASQLSQSGLGQSTVIGIGGDPIIGLHFQDILALFEADEATKQIVLIGEIGGTLEQQAAEYIKNHISKPVFAYIAGKTAPPGKTMGHAGAMIAGKKETALSKIQTLEDAGVIVTETISEIVKKIKN